MVDNLLMIKAEEIMEKIEEGRPVEYENIIIFGDLDLHRLDLPLDKHKRKIINSIIKIEYSVIKGDVFFDHSSFSHLVDFDGTVFDKSANFSDSQFQEDAGFSDSQFQGEANFSKAHFGIDANFSRAKFNDADFGRARFDKNFSLTNAKIYTLRLSDAFFAAGSNIHLKDFNFNRIVVRWNTIKDHLPFNGSVYLTLTKNFRNLERFEDEDRCYYQYRKEKQARTSKVVPQVRRSSGLAFLRLWRASLSYCSPERRHHPPFYGNILGRTRPGIECIGNGSATEGEHIFERCLLLQQHGVHGQKPAEFEHFRGLQVLDCDRNSVGVAAHGSISGHFE